MLNILKIFKRRNSAAKELVSKLDNYRINEFDLDNSSKKLSLFNENDFNSLYTHLNPGVKACFLFFPNLPIYQLA